MLFKYKAFKNDRVISSEMSADNASDLEQRLKSLGCELIKFSPIKKRSSIFGNKVSVKDLVSMCIHIAHLEKAGVPLFESLISLRDSAESEKMANVLGEIAEDLRNGVMLSEAFAKRPDVFDDVMINNVAAGEKTGNLSYVFSEIASHLKWGADIKKKLIQALTYPLFFLVLISSTITILMVFAVPQIVSSLEEQGIEIPGYTRALMSFSYFISNYFIWIIGFFAALFVGVKFWIRSSESLGIFVDAVKLKIPLIGAVLRKIEIARFCALFTLSYKSQLEITECIHIASNVVKNKSLRSSLELARHMIVNGTNVATSFEMANCFPPMVLCMMKTGEASGDFQGSLENVIFFYNNEINDSVDLLLGSIKPILIVVLGAVLGWVALSVFGPVYGSFSQMEL